MIIVFYVQVVGNHIILYAGVRNFDRVNNYNKPEMINKLEFVGINFPMVIKNILKFKLQNKLTQYVFHYKNDKIYPLLTRKKQVFDKTV